MEKCVVVSLFFSDNGLIILSVPLTGYIYQLPKTNFYYNTFHTINIFISYDYDRVLTLITLWFGGNYHYNGEQQLFSISSSFPKHFVFFVLCSPIWQPFATCGYFRCKLI